MFKSFIFALAALSISIPSEANVNVIRHAIQKHLLSVDEAYDPTIRSLRWSLGVMEDGDIVRISRVTSGGHMWISIRTVNQSLLELDNAGMKFQKATELKKCFPHLTWKICTDPEYKKKRPELLDFVAIERGKQIDNSPVDDDDYSSPADNSPTNDCIIQ